MRWTPLVFFALALAAIVVGLWTWLGRGRQRRIRRQVYETQLAQAVADGVLTEQELRELEELRATGPLSDAEVRMAAVAVYRRALADAMSDARITADEDATLTAMQELLGLSERDLAGDAGHVRRMRLLAQLERGQLPSVDSPVELPSDERAYWAVQATGCDRISLSERATDPPHLLFEAGRTEPFSAAGTRDDLAASSTVLPVDLGVLVVTEWGLRFHGARKRFETPHTRIRRVALFRDGLRVDLAEPMATRYFLVADPELTVALLLRVLRAPDVDAATSSG